MFISELVSKREAHKDHWCDSLHNFQSLKRVDINENIKVKTAHHTCYVPDYYN